MRSCGVAHGTSAKKQSTVADDLQFCTVHAEVRATGTQRQPHTPTEIDASHQALHAAVISGSVSASVLSASGAHNAPIWRCTME